MANLRILEIDENQNRAGRTAVPPIRGAPNWDDAARIPRPGPLLEWPRS
jgi:hypothetical protein